MSYPYEERNPQPILSS